MNQIQIETYENRKHFCPGEEISGIVSWDVSKRIQAVEVRLFWYTQGKGTRDVCVVETQLFENPVQTDSQIYNFKAPRGPYSFSGELISLCWAIEAVVPETQEAVRMEIIIAPQGVELELHAQKPQELNAEKNRFLV